jgi:hypothetical protein
MAVRGWGGSVATSTGVAAGVGAAQLGLGYGLGVVAWVPSAAETGDVTWVSGLAWAFWIAATSTVAGALVAHRLSSPSAPVHPSGPAGPSGPGAAAARAERVGAAGLLHRVLLAVAAAIGASLTAALVGVPARTATGAQTFSPQTIAAGYALLGLLVGLLIAIWALTSPAAATNLVATSCWLWLLAVIAVVDGVLAGRGLTSAQLGVWQFATGDDRVWFSDHLYWPGLLLSLGSAVVIGMLAARRPARSPLHRVGAAASGGAGPLLVAAAYFAATPQLTGIRPEQMSAHLVAPYAVIAGLAGSILVAALAQRAEHRGTGSTARGATEPGGPARTDAAQAEGGQSAVLVGSERADAVDAGPERGGEVGVGSERDEAAGVGAAQGGAAQTGTAQGGAAETGTAQTATGAAVSAVPGTGPEAEPTATTGPDPTATTGPDPTGEGPTPSVADRRVGARVPRPRRAKESRQEAPPESASTPFSTGTGDTADTGASPAAGDAGVSPATVESPEPGTTGTSPATGTRSRSARRSR